MYVCVCTGHAWCPLRLEEDVRSGTGVEVTVSWELNLRPLKEHPVLLTPRAIISLLPHVTYFSRVGKQAVPDRQCVNLSQGKEGQ